MTIDNTPANIPANLTKRNPATKMENFENVSNVETPLFGVENENKPVSGQRDGPAPVDYSGLMRLYIITQSIGLLLLILVFVWVTVFLDGFGFADAANTFNFHPMLMILGFIIIYSNGKRYHY